MSRVVMVVGGTSGHRPGHRAAGGAEGGDHVVVVARDASGCARWWPPWPRSGPGQATRQGRRRRHRRGRPCGRAVGDLPRRARPPRRGGADRAGGRLRHRRGGAGRVFGARHRHRGCAAPTTSPARCCPHFREHGGALVVVSSLLAQIAVPSMGSLLRRQVGPARRWCAACRTSCAATAGVSVSLVLPGAVDTPVYEQSATYAGRAGHAPPPVVGPDRVARACVRAIDHPRRQVHVGPANRLTVLGFRLLPGVYDRLAPLLVRPGRAARPPRRAAPRQRVAPRPEKEGVRGGWSFLGRRRHRRAEPS